MEIFISTNTKTINLDKQDYLDYFLPIKAVYEKLNYFQLQILF